jgi:signal transduction histidine kinase
MTLPLLFAALALGVSVVLTVIALRAFGRVSRDRARMQALAADVIETGDRERAAVALELHDSTAQRLAALLLNISAAARDARDPDLTARLASIRDAAEDVTNEVRTLAQSMHPRVLDDLGLVAALRKLGREASGSGIEVDVLAPSDIAPLPRSISVALYRVAQEAVRNAVQHAAPRQIQLTITVDAAEARLEVLVGSILPNWSGVRARRG